MDFQVANWFYNLFGKNKVILNIAKIITHIGDVWSIVFILAVLLMIKRTRKLGVYATITVLITFCFNEYFLKNIIGRARPFESHPEFMSVLEFVGYEIPSGASMASGHSTVSMCLATCVFMFHKKIGIGAISVSVICGLTRMILCVHYLTDVLVGFAIGIIFAILIHYLIDVIFSGIKMKKDKRKVLENENNRARN